MAADLFAEFGLDAHSNEAKDARHALDLYERTIEALVECRTASGLKQKEVAARMDTQQSAISDLENLTRDARFSTVIRYAQAIGVHLKIEVSKPRRRVDWMRGEAGGTLMFSSSTRSQPDRSWLSSLPAAETLRTDEQTFSAGPRSEAA
jgi:transcriptional regulator with XRE-family HTH domain